MSNLPPLPHHFRAEIARYQLERKAIAEITGMHVNALSNFIGGYRPMPKWARHNIAYAINTLMNRKIFYLDPEKQSLVPRYREVPLNPYSGVRLPVPPKKKKHRKRRAKAD